MSKPARPIRRLTGPGLARALVAGIRHLFGRREYINRINVFPVPDGDTGTNMAFTFKAILDVIERHRRTRLDRLMELLADAALDGARGNSGAIMAQFFQGCRESMGKTRRVDAVALATACQSGAAQAWGAMSEPVPGTLPTVLEDFAAALREAADEGVTDLQMQFTRALDRARASLANTPNQLPALRQAGVVDAGGQGFVDLLEGVQAWVERSELDPLDADTAALVSEEPGEAVRLENGDIGAHRFCTECVIEGQGLDRQAVMARLQSLDHSSMVVAGSGTRVRVHVHVNQPAEVFLACETFGEITQQKADDMRWQHGLLGQSGRVAVVTDSGADLPASEAERLGIHIVPVRLSLGGREYLDGVSLTPTEFYRMLEESDSAPQTSQPPPGDFRRVYELLTGHGYQVISVGLSEALSGTTQAARSAARRVGRGEVRVLDSRNASCGQGLLAMVAAEAAAQGMAIDDIMRLLERLLPGTITMAIPDDLAPAVRGGRVPAWVGRLAGALRLTPVLMARNGRMGVAGARIGRGAEPEALAGRILKRMDPAKTYRLMIAHADDAAGAREVRRILLERHPLVHSCHLAEAGPALGVHLGRGGLIASALPQPHELH